MKTVCRLHERSVISKSLEDALKMQASGLTLYIAGNPGTGKTSVAASTIEDLMYDYELEFVWLNAFDGLRSNQAYEQIYRSITGRSVEGQECLRFLEAFYHSNDKLCTLNAELSKYLSHESDLELDLARHLVTQPRVILIDEIDRVLEPKG